MIKTKHLRKTIKIDIDNYIDIIIHDPLFSEIRKRGHANFVWFIKFERISKEEKEIVCEDVPKCVILNIPENTRHDSNPLGELVQFK